MQFYPNVHKSSHVDYTFSETTGQLNCAMYLTCSISSGIKLYLNLSNVKKFKFKWSIAATVS